MTGAEYRAELAHFHKVLLAGSETSEPHRLFSFKKYVRNVNPYKPKTP